jgi:ribose/xylose/arabinose/galactoside ABC-type transport system permease subunit
MTGRTLEKALHRPEAPPLAFLLVILAVAGALTPGFLASGNLVAIFNQVAIVGIVALCLNQVIMTGEIDVSVGSVLALCALTYALVADRLGAAPALAAALVAGAATGLINGALVTLGRVPSIIVTLGMLMAVRGAVLLIGANGVVIVPDAARGLGLGMLAGLPVPVGILVLAFIALDSVNRHTVWGRDVLAVGGNRRAAAMVGLRTGWVRFGCFLLVGLGCGLAGAVFAGQTGQIQATAATGFELQCIAATVLGGTSISGGRGSTAAPVIGAVLVGVILNAMTLNKAPATYEQLVLGLLILLAIMIDALRRHAVSRQR